MKVFWATHDDQKFSESKSTIVPVTNDGAYHFVEVKMGDLPKFAGSDHPVANRSAWLREG